MRLPEEEMDLALRPAAAVDKENEEAAAPLPVPALALSAIAAAALAACGGGAGSPIAGAQRESTAEAAPPALAPVYRFAKISNGAYFFTGDRAEKDWVLSNAPDFRYEGIAFYRVVQDSLGIPVYRFANLGNGGYFYTANAAERDIVIRTRPDLRFEGSSFSVPAPEQAGALPVYRLANLRNGAYLYTASAAEREAAVASGNWRDEGVSFHTLAAPPALDVAETAQEAARFLLQAQFSASEAEIAAVRDLGFSRWLDQEMNRPVQQTAWDWLLSRGYSQVNEQEFFFTSYLGDFMIWYQLIGTPDPVRKRFALALSEMLVVSLQGIQDVLNWPCFSMAQYWDILNKHAFGNFRDLLGELTLNPAMGAFLNTRGNQKEDPVTGRVPDENFAREVMQLFTIGLVQLNLDGTPKLGPDGQPLETYSLDDVTNLAKVFTGYDLVSLGSFNSPKPPHPPVGVVDHVRRPMVLNPARHSLAEKKFLGVTIPAGTPAEQSLRTALDTLCQHPNVGPFFGRQMIQRLVTSDPSPAYVARVAAVFNDNGAGVRGDLRSVWRAILLDEEARGPAGLASPTFGKLREPALRFVQWGRTFRARSLAGTWKISIGFDPEANLSQTPLNPSSVFNFFRPGYVPPSTALAATGSTAPEFQIVNESSVCSYANFLQTFLGSGIWVTRPDLPYFPPVTNPPVGGPDIVPDYSAEKALVGNPDALVRRLNLLLCAGQLSTATERFISNALRIDRITDAASDDFKSIHVGRALLFVMSCSEYLVQK